jgi:ATP-binding cassette subfamily C protein CydD
LLSVAFCFSSGVMFIVQARLFSHKVQGVFIDKQPRGGLWPYFLVLFAIVLLRAALGWGREVAGFMGGAGIRVEIRKMLMAHLIAMGPVLLKQQQTGALTTTLLEQVEALHDFYAFYLPQLALAVMIPLAIAAFVFPVSWVAGTIFLLTAPLIPLFMILVGMGAESISQRNFQALARMGAHFLDILQGLTTLKLFDRSRTEDTLIAQVSRDYRKRTMQVLRVAFLSSGVLEFFSTVSIALVAVYLGLSYLGYIDFGAYGKPLTLAGGFFILLLAPDFYLALRELGTHYHARAEAVGAGKEIMALLASPHGGSLQGGTVLNEKNPLHLQCKSLYLAFEDGKRPVLNGLNLDLKPGEHVVIVGSSGAGKSTIANLILGFLKPDKGAIHVNDTDLSTLAAESWHSRIAWIGQDPVLFHGTIRENICMGRPEASDQEIEQAARAARVLNFTADYAKGLMTEIGEQGVGLSRGQAQRVALARAFLKDASILVLDEPTAGLDTENEWLVLESLQELSEGRTVLMLTHRLVNIENADRIAVLSEGKIVEEGSYSKLLAARGGFAALIDSQMEDGKHDS